MKATIKTLLFCVIFLTGQAPVQAVVKLVNTPAQQVQQVEKTTKQAKRKARKQQRAALLAAIRANDEDLVVDYLMATGAALSGLALPWIVIFAAFSGGWFLALSLFALPLVLGIAVLIRHAKRKKEGRKTPNVIRVLAWIGLLSTGVWVLAALLSR
jgi:fatty acid desaturase